MTQHLIPMTIALAFGLFVGTAFADTDATAPDAQCPLIGPTQGLSEECTLLRATFREGMTACMQDMKIKAAAHATDIYMDNAHTSRARTMICERQVRDRMGLAN